MPMFKTVHFYPLVAQMLPAVFRVYQGTKLHFPAIYRAKVLIRV